MASHVALLRGINVGGHNKVPMADLRAAIEAAGFGSVQTYIQSGNVLFDAPRGETHQGIADRVADVMRQSFDLSVPIVLRAASDFLELEADGHPMADSGIADNLLMVGFCSHTPGSQLDIDVEAYSPDRAEMHGSEVFLAYPQGSARSRLTVDVLERNLGTSVTIRNWRTVARIASLLGA